MKTEQAIAFVKQVAALELFEESDAERGEDNADGVSYEWITSNHEALEGLILKARELVDTEVTGQPDMAEALLALALGRAVQLYMPAEPPADQHSQAAKTWLVNASIRAAEGAYRAATGTKAPEAPTITTIPASYPWIKANAHAEKWSDVTLAVVLSRAHSEKAPEDAYAWEPNRNIEGVLKHSNFYWQTMSELRLNVCLAHNHLRLAKLEAAYRELGFDLQEASAGEVCSACGRPEWDCSEDPCEAVQRDREVRDDSELVVRPGTHGGFDIYQRKGSIEARPYFQAETLSDRVSISPADREGGSPKAGDMIARNPKNHEDQWLIAAAYFAEHYGAAEGTA